MIFHSDDNLDPNAVKVIDELEKENNDLRKQNKRYREAIESCLTESEFEDMYEQLERIIRTLSKALEETE